MSVIERTTEQDIMVPPSLPVILKQFCKAAIRTQPYDLLKWSSSYFRALADGEEPPTKLRLEYPPPSTASGLTLGFLRILLRQFGDYNKSLPVETIIRRWDCLCLDRRDLNVIMVIGKFRRKCVVKKFLAIAVGLLGSSLFETMIMICELFTREPDGGSAMIPVTLFMEIYGYLAGLRCDGSERSSPDEDPAEFIIYDEPNDSRSLESREVNEEIISPDRVCSIASQDTEADVNLDLELVSKADTDSARTDTTPKLTGSYDGHKNAADDKTEEDSSKEGTLKAEGINETSATEVESTKKSSSGDEKESNTSENVSEKGGSKGSTSEGNQSVQSEEGKASSERKGRKKKIMDSKLLKHYPNIPGIGARLSAEEVANVAIWLSECARVQDGMVGPRNLRHMNCPPLDRQKTPKS